MIKSEYNDLMAKIADGGKVSQSTFDELTEFAKAKKVKRPPADSVIDSAAIAEAATTVAGTPDEAKPAKAPKAPKEKKAPKVKGTCNPKSVGSKEKCDKEARSNGLCATHYSRLVYRANPDNAQKARDASKAYAAKKRAEKAAAKAAATATADAA